eukprot:gene5349-5585_t
MSDQVGGAAALPEQQDLELQQLHAGAAQQQDAADAIAPAQGGEELEDEHDAESEDQDIFEQLMQDAMDEDFEVEEVDEVDAEDMWHMEDDDGMQDEIEEADEEEDDDELFPDDSSDWLEFTGVEVTHSHRIQLECGVLQHDANFFVNDEPIRHEGPAQLLAANGTWFRHYSIAASPCGNFVACTGASGAVVLFKMCSRDEARSAVRLTTCAIKNIAPDLAAEEELAEALAAAEAAEEVAAGPNAVPDALQAAAEAQQDVNAARAKPKLLPLNVTASSPDGSWLAVGSDQTAVVLLPAAPGYQRRRCQVLDMCPISRPHQPSWQPQGQIGCQYVTFNSSSTLLAASSDYLRLVSVFEVPTGRLLATFSLHNRPVLPVRFMASGHHLQQAGLVAADGEAAGAPLPPQGAAEGARAAPGSSAEGEGAPSSSWCWGDKVLVYCEEEGGLHIVDLSTFFAAEPSPLLTAGNAGAGAGSSSVPAAAAVPTKDTKPEGGGSSSDQIPAAAPAQATDISARELLISDRFCLKSYIEVAQPAGNAPPGPGAAATSGIQAGAAAQGGAGAADPPAAGQVPPAADELPHPAGHNPIIGLPPEMMQLLQQHNLLVPQPMMQEWQQAWAMEQRRRKHRINGLAVTPAGRVVLACPVLSQLPGVMLEQIVQEAAAPQVSWAAVSVPTWQQLSEALDGRPRRVG